MNYTDLPPYASFVYTLDGVYESVNVSIAGSWVPISSYPINATTNMTTAADRNCVVWEKPPRIILETVILLTLVLNVLAGAVVFRVPVDVRGRHVAFLFWCVRILNILDIFQCLILLLGPIAMPADCNPNRILCGLLGFLFTTTALFSPLTAIVMAVDRAVAVYFHLIYKANPYLKLKFTFISFLFVSNGVYLLLPCVTSFSEYVPVPWLALCFLEWGMTYRLYDLILAFYTATLILILIMANIAIIIKIRTRKHEIKRIKARPSAPSTKHRSKTRVLKSEVGEDFDSAKLHRSAEDVARGAGDDSLIFDGASPFLTYRSKPPRPPSLEIDRINLCEYFDRPKPPISPLLGNTRFTLMTSESNKSSKFTVSGNKRPTSLSSPLEAKSFLPSISPMFPRSPRKPPPSPLTVSKRKQEELTTIKTLMQNNRSSSADDVLRESTAPSLTPSRFSFPKPLLRQVLDYSNKPSHEEESTMDTCKSSEETNFLPRNHSTSSFFSLAQSTTKGGSLKSKRSSKKRVIRKKVSRITKMTLIICLVFIVLYVPFLVRKLIQLIPESYNAILIPTSVEVITLFGPFLSPLFNPIIYVFLNPHYKKSFKHLCRKLSKFFSSCCRKITLRKQKKFKKALHASAKQPNIPTFGDLEMVEDVFLPNSPKNMCSGPAVKGFSLGRIRSNDS